ncbi:MAG: alpha/beta fold hydrolase [Gemmatimonadaceae bacterium]|nr:alpha/beta fold hydrolase [Gemmatimonadaceae bacterium]
MIFLPFSRSGRAVIALLIGVIVALVVGVLMPRSARAQGAPVRFAYLQGADTIASEVVTISPTAARGVLQYRGQPRIEWEQAHQNEQLGVLTLRVFAPGSADGAAPLQSFVIAGKGDSMIVDMSGNGQSQRQAVLSKAGAVALVGQSVVHASLVSQYAKRHQLTTLSAFMTSGGQTMDATFSDQGGVTTLTVANLPIVTTWVDGVPSVITIAPQNLRAVRTAGAPSTPRAPERINYDAPAGAPYTAESVTIQTSRGYTLAGTLTRPAKAAGRVPVVITISGSGPQERDSRLSVVKGYMPFREMADTLARRGIAVLRYDDRGVGESGGRGALRDTATSVDFADDVLSVVQYLRTRSDVDGTRIALAGHSEGGLIAPIAAVKDPSVRAVVLIAGPAYNGRKILEYQNDISINAAPGLTTAQRDSIRARVPAALDSIARSSRWMRYFMTADPLVTARQLKQPVLILQGDTDMQVTPEQADTLARVIRSTGNTTVTMRRFPATNHLLLNDPSGSPFGYAKLTDVHVRREVLGTLADWLVTTLKP